MQFIYNFRLNEENGSIQSVINDFDQNLRPLFDGVHRQGTVSLHHWLQTHQAHQSPQYFAENSENPPPTDPIGNPPNFIVNVTNENLNIPSSVANDTSATTDSSQEGMSSNVVRGLNLLVQQNPQFSQALQIVVTCIPFLILILLKQFYEHITGNYFTLKFKTKIKQLIYSELAGFRGQTSPLLLV